MEVGLALPQFDYSVPGEPSLRADTLIAWATAAERAGFDSVWLADHVFLEVTKYGGPPGRFDGFDPIVALGALARATSRVRLGTLVICSQLRPPTVLAKMLAGVDRLSGGRLIVGVGAGWYEPEFAAAGVPFERPGLRVDQMAETAQILKGMWATAPADATPFSFDGDHYLARQARCRPGPHADGGPPIWVGGRGDRSIDVAIRHCDGWNQGGWDVDPDDYARRVTDVEERCQRAGRDPATFTRSVNIGNAAALAPDQLRDRLARFRDLGVATAVVGLGALAFSVTTIDAIDVVASILA
jgi:probable F420-dependent oxidoreductase